MNPNDLMEAFKDVQVPAETSWWPLAWGWWLVIILALVLVIALGRYIYQHKKFNAFKKQIIKQLKPSLSAKQAAVLLKQLAMHYYGRTSVASLSASQMHEFWLNTVVKHTDKSAKKWQQAELNLLSALYSQQYTAEAHSQALSAEQLATVVKLVKQISRKNGAQDV
ncbi:DUF4381 domain-containing protein [Catenovulum sp. SX2]|uniref:DUF4381 domain-containing protein n=1 Tax=Catenovulum sp. SX2 TaxID=3398614 RepID=UPI003F844D2E